MICCPICDSLNVNYLAKKNGYQLFKCVDCSHMFSDVSSNSHNSLENLEENDFRTIITNNIMKNDEDFYHHLCEGEKEGFHSSITFNIIDKLIQSCDFLGSPSWLDVGCGAGFIVKKMSDLGWDAIGLEPGGWGQIAASERHLNIVKGFLTKDTFKTKFDVISATDVLEHQSNPYEFINLIKCHLKPGGLLVLSLPFADSLFAKVFKSNWSMIAPPTHCQFFTNKSINTLATNTEFNIIKKVQYNSYRIPFFGRFKIINKMFDFIFKFNNLGDQAVVLLKLNENKEII